MVPQHDWKQQLYLYKKIPYPSCKILLSYNVCFRFSYAPESGKIVTQFIKKKGGGGTSKNLEKWVLENCCLKELNSFGELNELS